MDKRERTCCFTGHRNIPVSELPELQNRVNKTIMDLIESGVCYFGTGGAVGFDTIAAEEVINLRSRYPQIKLILVLPCPEQADKWNPKAKAQYERIKRCADKIVYTSTHYTSDCMYRRNRHLVDGSSICVGNH